MDSKDTLDFIDSDQAVHALKHEELVGLPTETVYGLAARMDSEKALTQIFELKQRPLYDPLILHISDIEMLKDLVLDFDNSTYSTSLQLAEKFWPGGLTLLFPKNPKYVSDLITADMDTVAVRMPYHPVALDVIRKVGVPLAAPSANPFKKTSPTTAALVKSYFPDLKVIDGGSCEVGIESTIVDAKDKNKIRILRPGMITAEDILKALEVSSLKVTHAFDQQGPGSMKEHYQPQKPLFLIQGSNLSSEDAKRHLQKNLEISFLQKHKLNERLHVLRINEVHLDSNPLLCARHIYRQLFESSQNSDLMFINWNTATYNSLAWQSILNRLEKAALKNIVI